MSRSANVSVAGAVRSYFFEACEDGSSVSRSEYLQDLSGLGTSQAMLDYYCRKLVREGFLVKTGRAMFGIAGKAKPLEPSVELVAGVRVTAADIYRAAEASGLSQQQDYTRLIPSMIRALGLLP